MKFTNQFIYSLSLPDAEEDFINDVVSKIKEHFASCKDLEISSEVLTINIEFDLSEKVIIL